MTSKTGQARVLVVDDTRFDRELVKSAIESIAEVECCASAEEALRALERAPADLVLSDLLMPGLSGIDLLERVRCDHSGTDFLLLTARASVETAIDALRMGASDYIRKPIQPVELALVVERILARRHLVRENSRLQDELETVEACRNLSPCLEPGEVYPVALDLVLRILRRERGIALFHRGFANHPDAVGFRGIEESHTSQLRELLVRDKAVDLDGIRDLEVLSRGPVHDALRSAGISVGRLLAIPIRSGEDEGGVLWIFADDRPFSSTDLEHASIVSVHATLALRNAERYVQAKARAFIDDVTEVYNARYLMEAADREIRRAERYENELTFLFLDIDRFKLVNDRFGHLVGSRSLRRLSQVLAQCVRQVDTLSRYGGDEFTILLVETGRELGVRIADRIRRAVADTPFETGAAEPVFLTVAIGVATYPFDGRTREELLEASDKAMYLAKSRGRNQVCSASELENLPPVDPG